ncbi:extracellular superoxide dismutase [Cu-Zn]-like [Polypterus senegalus]|nr:extracellular superoxide dismutase [Cu-Zn]-like [Polypterus senegalus]XP_039607524.1 extracellular superoxide dismutase [Cu-Zn]-like [Polypterus senegalus]
MKQSAFYHHLALLFISHFVSQIQANYESCPLMLKNIESKVDDLWQSLLHPVALAAKDIKEVYAICEMKPSSTLEAEKPQVTGQVLFKQTYPSGHLETTINLVGFSESDNQARAIHIHEFGDLSNGCDATGGHFNPMNVSHPGHPGDFGNFTPKKGKIKKYRKNIKATMFGPHSILSRAIVIHEQQDDLGEGGNPASLINGNAGKRLACCVIGIGGKTLWQSTFLSLTGNSMKRNASGSERKLS